MTVCRSLLFVLYLIPLILVLRKPKACYEWGNGQCRVNHLLFMGNLQMLEKDYNQIDAVVQTVHFVSSDIKMEFCIEKSELLILRRGKVDKKDGKVFWECCRRIKSKKEKRRTSLPESTRGG